MKEHVKSGVETPTGRIEGDGHPSAPIRRRMGAAFGAGSLVLLVGIVSLLSVWQLVKAFTDVEESTHVETELRQIVGGFSDAEAGLRGYLLTTGDRFLDQYQNATRRTRLDVEHVLRDLDGSSDLREEVARFRTAADRKFAAMDSISFVAVTRGTAPASDLLRSGLSWTQMDSVRAAVNALANAGRGAIAEDARQRDRTTWIAAGVIAGGSAIAFILLVIVLIAVRREIMHEARLQKHLIEQAQRLDAQATELELQNEQLQDQAVALEEQSSELEAQQSELEAANEELLTANMEMEASRERLRHLLDTAEMGMYGVDETGVCTFMNPAGARILGYRPEELIGQRIHALVHHTRADGSPYPLDECAILAALKAGSRVRRDDEVYWRKDGSPMSVDYTVAPVAAATGSLRTAVVSFMDITDRRRAQEIREFLSDATTALNSSLDYHETLATVARLAVPRLGDWCAVDILEDGRLQRLAVVHSDPGRVRLVEKLTAKRPPRLDAPAGSGYVVRTGRPQLIAEIPEDLLVASAEGDVELIQALQELGLRSLLAVPLKARDETIGAFVCVMAESGRRFGEQDLALAEDLATRASLAIENALLFSEAEEARDRAESADKAKSQFLAAMSHELRTPLNAIAGYAELLTVGVHGPITEKQRHALERITRSQKTLLSLINDILNFSKLQAGYVQVAMEEVQMAPLLDSLDDWIEPQLRSKNLSYHYEPCASDLRVRGDREKIQQIMLNLLSNAVKFTPGGGRISVRCETGETEIRILVSDTGPGIPAEKVDEIFEPFVQIDRGVQSTYQGTGLGLAISRDLAHAMRGNIAVGETSARGSTFVLTLPRVRKGAREKEQQLSSSLAPAAE
jgi:PAS domain S-box-containing protein